MMVFDPTDQNVYRRGRELDEDECVRSLGRRGCVINGKEIRVERARLLGNKSWGILSFLCRFRGYILEGVPAYSDRIAKDYH